MGIDLTEEQKRELRKDASLAKVVDFDLADALISLQAQLDALPQDDSVDKDAMADDAVGSDEVDDSLADTLVQVGWGTPEAEAGNKIEVELQLADAKGEALALECALELHVSDGTAYASDSGTATISLGAGAEGEIISGDDTAAVRAKTSATGKLSVEVSEAGAGTRHVTARPTYWCPILGSMASAELTFV